MLEFIEHPPQRHTDVRLSETGKKALVLASRYGGGNNQILYGIGVGMWSEFKDSFEHTSQLPTFGVSETHAVKEAEGILGDKLPSLINGIAAMASESFLEARV